MSLFDFFCLLAFRFELTIILQIKQISGSSSRCDNLCAFNKYLRLISFTDLFSLRLNIALSIQARYLFTQTS